VGSASDGQKSDGKKSNAMQELRDNWIGGQEHNALSSIAPLE
jgi:hypothetical protein